MNRKIAGNAAFERNCSRLAEITKGIFFYLNLHVGGIYSLLYTTYSLFAPMASHIAETVHDHLWFTFMKRNRICIFEPILWRYDLWMVLELILIAIQHDNYRYRGYDHLLFPFKKNERWGHSDIEVYILWKSVIHWKGQTNAKSYKIL